MILQEGLVWENAFLVTEIAHKLRYVCAPGVFFIFFNK